MIIWGAPFQQYGRMEENYSCNNRYSYNYSAIIVSSSYWEQEYTMPSTQECKLNFNPLHGAVSTFKRRRPPWSTLLSVHHRWECIAPALFWRTARIIILGLKCARRITQSAWSSPQLRPHPHSKCSWWWDLESNPGWSLSSLDPLDWVEFLQSDLWGRITASGKIWNFISRWSSSYFVLGKVRECAIGRSYDDCDGDNREERACNEDQVDARGWKLMMTLIIGN